MAPQYTLSRFIVKSLHSCFDALWPSECVVCKREGDWVCAECLSAAEIPEANPCPLCGGVSMSWQCCSTCKERGLDGAWSRWLYRGPIRQLVHAYKYKAQLSMVPWLAAQLLGAFGQSPETNQIIVSAIPTTRAKIAKRGFNQSELLAQTVAEQLGMRYHQYLGRQQHSTSQTKLSREERFANVRGHFAIRERPPPDTIIILVDDVLTTGATLSECARILKENGATSVWAVTLAKD